MQKMKRKLNWNFYSIRSLSKIVSGNFIQFFIHKERSSTVKRSHEMEETCIFPESDAEESFDASSKASRSRFKLTDKMKEKLADTFASHLDKYLPLFDERVKKTTHMSMVRELLVLIRANVNGYSDLKEQTLVRWLKYCKDNVAIWKEELDKEQQNGGSIASGAHDQPENLFKFAWVNLMENVKIKLSVIPSIEPPSKKICFNGAPVSQGKKSALMERLYHSACITKKSALMERLYHISSCIT
jgi:hypothetical protein